MGILEDVIKELGTNELDQQVRELCDLITQEERGGKDYDGPDGPNIFLSLQVNEYKGKKEYITLERENPEKYIIGRWLKGKPPSPLNRKKVWEVEENQANRIIKYFANKLIFLKGE